MSNHRPTNPRVSALTSHDVRDVPVSIYALCEPETGEIRYIGKSQDPKARASSHVSVGYHGRNVALCDWVHVLRECGARPTVRVLCVVPPGADASPVERALIREHDGPRLLNVRGTSNVAARLAASRESNSARGYY